MVLIFVVAYFFMIRPQMKRQKDEKKFAQTLKKGAKIITRSGIHGKVVEVNDKDATCIIETMSGRLKIERSSISSEMSKKLNPIEKK